MKNLKKLLFVLAIISISSCGENLTEELTSYGALCYTPSTYLHTTARKYTDNSGNALNIRRSGIIEIILNGEKSMGHIANPEQYDAIGDIVYISVIVTICDSDTLPLIEDSCEIAYEEDTPNLTIFSINCFGELGNSLDSTWEDF